MRVLILGFDAYDPATFEQLSERGKLPNLSTYVKAGNYSRFSVANPPQTEVSWTSIATGADPGGHGVFDFIHRNPNTYTPYLSVLPTKRGRLGTSFVPPYTTRTIFEEATRQGFPATTLWWPATFPARPELPVRSVPGLGTPDIQGRWGVGTLLSTDVQADDDEFKTDLVQLERRGKSRYAGQLNGPVRKKAKGTEQATVKLEIEIREQDRALLRAGECSVELTVGQWSPIVELSFRMGLLVKIRAITRVILTQVQPEVRLYALPLQLHPLHAPWRYATPRTFVKKIWSRFGPFLTLGWPQDTTALEEGWITDAQFLDLCTSIFDARERIFLHQLDQFGEGILAAVFDSLDRVQHMFRRDRPDIVEEWYVKLDGLVGRAHQKLSGAGRAKHKTVIVSDHGFARYDYAVHLNRWLIAQGYLTPKAEGIGKGNLRDVDWSQSQAYAVGLNSLYLNLQGREGQGSVQASERESLLRGISDQLRQWDGPDGRPVVHSTTCQEDAFHGPFAEFGPDLVVGYSPGYRASAETGLGEWKENTIEPNRDHWGADHCVYPQAVPGVLFCNQGLADFTYPSYFDIPAITIGTTLEGGISAPPPSLAEEDEKVIEERLRGLGYL
jgi:predicted AlkP superfamily phosphohydrolase/phosphomutase